MGKNKSNKKDAIIDIEFTGLDKTFITDNEIIQVKLINTTNGKAILRNFNSKKPLSAHTQLEHRVTKYIDCPYFSDSEFNNMLNEIELEIGNTKFFGFGTAMDIKMLSKYGINIQIEDIQTKLQRSKFAYRMATEGSSLEATYLIVTGKYPDNINHASIDELNIIYELYKEVKKIKKLHRYMKYVPFGHCAGMKIYDYVGDYRRAADGYRYNNNDEFAKALDYYISLRGEEFYGW